MTKHARMTLFSLLFALCFGAFASDLSEQGSKLFMENKPLEAVSVLELAVKESGADERLHLYLGIAYIQLERYDDALAAFRRGLSVAVVYRHQFFFNIGNAYFLAGKSAFALESYDQALGVKSDYPAAYLNRANVKIRLGDTFGAVDDYSTYLALEPSSAQASEIRRLIDLINSKVAAANQAKALADAQKLAEEQAKAALQASVTQSLLDAAAATTNLSAGSGDVQGYDNPPSLDD